MIRLHLLQIIGTCPASPLFVRMWCLKQTMIIIQQHIEKLPPELRARFDKIDAQHGVFRG